MRVFSVLAAVALVGCNGDNQITIHDGEPTVTIVGPVAGATFDPTEPVSLCASVADNETPTEDLVYLLQSDKDGELADESAGFNDCPGGNLALTVTLSDQVQTLSLTVIDDTDHATTATVSIAPTVNTAPHCDIFEPLANSVFAEGERVQFRAEVEDDESDPSSLTVEVSSNIDGLLWDDDADSKGEVLFDTSVLSPGNQFITLSVTDSRGLRDDCEVALTIDACVDIDDDGFTICEDDCDDALADAYPGAPELLDGHDNDCDGDIDEGTSLFDDDGDGFTEADGDCNDTNAAINPAATEVWYDGLDQDCDKASDFDQDHDGFDSSTFTGSDCDDTKANVNPTIVEVYYDGVDANCDGRNDNDADGDGDPALAYGGHDCLDTDPLVSSLTT